VGHRLDALDLSLHLSHEEERERLERGGRRLVALRLALGGLMDAHALGPPVCLVFEGWDASGKGGAIKRLVAPLDPRHVRVAAFAAPTDAERRHHFLARFVPALPGWGGMAVLDRSWYGRVLVERVEAFAPEPVWRRAYPQIVGFEEGLVAEGTLLVKFWLHISAEEQLRRFEARARDPLKAWKLTEDDWRNRARRADYEDAIEEMLARTARPRAPWVLVEAESKPYARVKVMEATITAIEQGMRDRGFDPPPAP
jgi:polyphosphate kinase 2 (PPK2 family)